MPIKIEYGWKPPRPAHRPRKLTPQQELEIVRRIKIGGERREDLRREYGIAVATLRLIVKRTPLPVMDLAPPPTQIAAK